MFNSESEDLGFRVFKLSESNFKVWRNYHGESVQELQTNFLDFEQILISNWKEKDIVVEILLAEGFPLDSRNFRSDKFLVNRILVVESNYVEHRLFICLDESIADETAQQLQQLGYDDVFICLDSALTDQAKMRLSDACNIKTI